MRPLANQSHVDLRFKVSAADMEIEVDSVRIVQVAQNMIGNAIRFSPPGSEILIALSPVTLPSGRRRNDHSIVPGIALTVADSGPGIPEDELDTIFDKFVQSSKTKTGAGGTGLGLAISREIATLHCGEIRARNRATGGAEFILTLPCQQPKIGDAS
jgi:signal transduction histidine kinase